MGRQEILDGARKRTGMMVLLTSIAVHQCMPANGEHFTTTTLFWWLVVTNVFLAVVMVQMNLLRFLTKTMPEQAGARGGSTRPLNRGKIALEKVDQPCAR
ncbi:MAG: hypothetical protein IPO90_15925 [Flavobacteriales bacterium]|nr:hypothetical protein [Flavobacteriales bacterium]